MEEKLALLKFRNLIDNIKKRKSMYLVDDTYSSLVSFIQGYCFAVKDLNGFDISNDFQEWLRKKEKQYFAVIWSGYILYELCGKDEILAEKKLFSLFDDFLMNKIII